MSRIPGYRTDSGWIRSMRGEKAPTSYFLPCGWFNEQERGPDGAVEEVSAILLTNRECPYSCLMCDLWKHTTTETVPPGAIPAQVEYALERLNKANRLKLYNSGSFFDPGAIPVEVYGRIATLCSGFKSVLVESHPSFIGKKCLDFNTMLQCDLQVAIGLESVHPEVLPLLNKGMTLEGFKQGVDFLLTSGITVRAFILLRPPFLSEQEGVEWACRSIDFAFACGVDVCSVIPVRLGNGALDLLASQGYFEQPSIRSLERVIAYGIGLKKGLVFADLWDLDRFSLCDHCFDARQERLRKMNLQQLVQPTVSCSC
jgi:radical SAM enzyme (TIGR01210 family)